MNIASIPYANRSFLNYNATDFMPRKLPLLFQQQVILRSFLYCFSILPLGAGQVSYYTIYPEHYLQCFTTAVFN